MKTANKKIEDKYVLMYQGMIEKNAQILNEILDDHFFLIHMTGLKQNKKDFIRAVLDGTLNYFSADHEEMKIIIEDDKAYLTGRSRVVARVFGGAKNTWNLELKIELILEKDNWKIKKAIAGTY